MRLALPKLLLLPFLALTWLSCDQDINSAKDQPLVDYVLVVSDSSSSLPLDSVRVRVTTITGDTATYTTNPEEGRVQLATVASSRTLLQLTRKGYNSRDSIDTVNAPVDSIFHRPVTRLLRIKMSRTGTVASDRAQINLLPRDANLEKLKKTMVLYEDSTGDLRSISDTGGTGVVGLKGLKAGKNMVLVRHPGYLGHWIEVTVEKIPDTASVRSQVVSLLALGGNRITGQVSYATSTGAEPLLGAKVQFLLKDSLAVPDTFTTFTSSKPEDLGRFVLDSVPALDGQILYFKDRTSREAIKSVPIVKEEVLRDGPLPRITLTINSDSTLPILVESPKDSVNPKDSLFFRFSQKVDALDGYTIRLINQSQLLVDTAWNKEKTQLKIWQRGANWIRGKKYEYELTARNPAGQYFTAQGDSLKVLKGIFSVPDSSAGADSSLLLPKNISFGYYNSGAHYLFSEADSNSSPKPDSTSEFARLKWNWSAGSGHKVESLLLYYKDGGISADNWTLWGAVSGQLDSATLVFSDHYATSRAASQKPTLPFKIPGGKIYFMVVPKQAGKVLQDTSLDAIAYGMGPNVYSFIAGFNTPLKNQKDEVDTLKVEFRKSEKDPSSVFNWSIVQPTPIIYFNEVKADTSLAKWKWADSTTGHIVYKLPPLITTSSKFRVDLNGQLYLGKPIWHRNRKNEFVLP
jgi:hypothetical protein